jgi:uncharacterized protein YecE (DUF72 family)
MQARVELGGRIVYDAVRFAYNDSMSEQPHPILIGCSGWSYPDWEGAFYPDGMRAAEYLAYYADRFPIVEVDSTFYRVPTPSMVRGWRDRTPEDFKFAPKVPQVITHQKQLRDCGREVEEFVASIRPLGAKTSCALLQMGYFNRGAFGSLEEFLDVLDAFLETWPHREVPLAVEIRNPRWVGSEFAAVLKRHQVALTLTEQKWMPTPAQVAERIDPVTGPLAFVRLIGDREAIEKVATTWDKVVVDRSAELAETAGVIRTLAARVPVAVFVNNHYAGHAPTTVRALRALLGQPDPVPPERPRTTLFD